MEREKNVNSLPKNKGRTKCQKRIPQKHPIHTQLCMCTHKHTGTRAWSIPARELELSLKGRRGLGGVLFVLAPAPDRGQLRKAGRSWWGEHQLEEALKLEACPRATQPQTRHSMEHNG